MPLPTVTISGRGAAMLDAPPFSGAAEAGDHFVGDQQRAEIFGDRLNRGQPVVGRYHVAGGALHRLGDDRGERAAGAHLDLLAREIDAVKSAVGILQLERTSVAVGVRHSVLPARQRTIALLRFVADKSDDAAGLAVEAAPEAHHLMLSGRGTRQPERGFDRLRAAAIKMCALESRGRDFAQQLERRRALLGREGADHQPRRLIRQRLRQSGMRMAKACDRDAGEKIDVDVAVGVGERRAFAVIEGDTGEQRDALAAGRDIFLFEVEDLLRLGSGNCSLDRGKFSVGGCRGLQLVAVRILLLDFRRDC